MKAIKVGDTVTVILRHDPYRGATAIVLAVYPYGLLLLLPDGIKRFYGKRDVQAVKKNLQGLQ